MVCEECKKAHQGQEKAVAVVFGKGYIEVRGCEKHLRQFRCWYMRNAPRIGKGDVE
jgi:hypothetical protein